MLILKLIFVWFILLSQEYGLTLDYEVCSIFNVYCTWYPYFIFYHSFIIIFHLYLFARMQEHFKIKSLIQSHWRYCFFFQATNDMLSSSLVGVSYLCLILIWSLWRKLLHWIVLWTCKKTIIGFTWDSGRSLKTSTLCTDNPTIGNTPNYGTIRNSQLLAIIRPV